MGVKKKSGSREDIVVSFFFARWTEGRREVMAIIILSLKEG